MLHIMYRSISDGAAPFCHLDRGWELPVTEESPADAGDGVRDIDSMMQEELEKRRELEYAREQADIANQAKSNFLFNMSHDIRTPMNAILGFTALSEKYDNDPVKRAEYRAKIRIAGNQLLDILNNVLEMARIESGKLCIDYDLVNVAEFQTNWLTMFENDLRKKHIVLYSASAFDHEYVYADRTHLTEILMNILSNAIKYTPDYGTIRITHRELAGSDEEHCVIETVVEDNGIGMTKEFLCHVFENFERERTTPDCGIQGTGLGLAITKRLTDLMDGSIEIDSEQGRGTTVTLRIPHRIGRLPVLDGVPADEMSLLDCSGKRILLAEDNDMNAEIACELLAYEGFEVVRAVDGVDCIEKLQESGDHEYECILMDVQMPRLDGYKAAEYIRCLPDAARAGIPIIAMTANAFAEDRQRALQAGMNGHIAKPISRAAVLQTIASVLKESERKEMKLGVE